MPGLEEAAVHAALRVWWGVPAEETLIDHVDGDEAFLKRSIAEMGAAIKAAEAYKAS